VSFAAYESRPDGDGGDLGEDIPISDEWVESEADAQVDHQFAQEDATSDPWAEGEQPMDEDVWPEPQPAAEEAVPDVAVADDAMADDAMADDAMADVAVPEGEPVVAGDATTDDPWAAQMQAVADADYDQPDGYDEFPSVDDSTADQPISDDAQGALADEYPAYAEDPPPPQVDEFDLDQLPAEEAGIIETVDEDVAVISSGVPADDSAPAGDSTDPVDPIELDGGQAAADVEPTLVGFTGDDEPQ